MKDNQVVVVTLIVFVHILVYWCCAISLNILFFIYFYLFLHVWYFVCLSVTCVCRLFINVCVMSAVCSETALFFLQFILLLLITFGKSPGPACQLNSLIRNSLNTYACYSAVVLVCVGFVFPCITMSQRSIVKVIDPMNPGLFPTATQTICRPPPLSSLCGRRSA